MPATFPSLSWGNSALYPAARSLQIPTRIVRFQNDNEQRWQITKPLNRWVLAYDSLKKADRDTLYTFFLDVKGAHDSTWTFALDASYLTCGFEDDVFNQQEISPGRYSVTLRLRQVAPSGTYASGLPTVYPLLSSGFRVQKWAQTATFRTSRNDMEAGPRFAWPWRATPLRAWTLAYPTLSDVNAGTIIDFFASQLGSYLPFSFIDPDDGIDRPNCRFARDVLERRHIGNGLNSMTVEIEEFAP